MYHHEVRRGGRNAADAKQKRSALSAVLFASITVSNLSTAPFLAAVIPRCYCALLAATAAPRERHTILNTITPTIIYRISAAWPNQVNPTRQEPCIGINHFARWYNCMKCTEACKNMTDALEICLLLLMK